MNSLAYKILASVVLIGTAAFISRIPAGNSGAPLDSAEIQLRQDGYYPDKIKIRKGSSVKFTATEDFSFFWPASDVHPVHSIYPEFDPKEPVSSSDSWSFEFNKSGKWQFHDHLYPYFVGEIEVVEDSSYSSLTETNCTAISKLDNMSKEKCFIKLLEDKVETEGVKQAFALFKELFEKEPFFTEDCHQYAHKIGDVYFRQYLKNGRNHEAVSLPGETFYCGYGFYHGFLEHLFRDDPNIAEAIKFCDYLDSAMSSKIPRIRLNCYHGMGHGFMPEPPNKSAWGNPDRMTLSSLEKCGLVSKDPQETSECRQGIYNTLANWIYQSNYGLSPDGNDPLKICDNQKNKSYQLDCYYELSMRINSYVNDDLVEIANKYVNRIPDNSIASMVMHSASASVIQRAQAKNDHSEYILSCKSIAERISGSCLTGLIGGFIAHGEPGKEYVKALKVCDSDILSETEKILCYKHLRISMNGVYTIDKIGRVCDMIESKYKKYCSEQ